MPSLIAGLTMILKFRLKPRTKKLIATRGKPIVESPFELVVVIRDSASDLSNDISKIVTILHSIVRGFGGLLRRESKTHLRASPGSNLRCCFQPQRTSDHNGKECHKHSQSERHEGKRSAPSRKVTFPLVS